MIYLNFPPATWQQRVSTTGKRVKERNSWTKCKLHSKNLKKFHLPVKMRSSGLLHFIEDLFDVYISTVAFSPAQNSGQVISRSQRQDTNLRSWLKRGKTSEWESLAQKLRCLWKRHEVVFEQTVVQAWRNRWLLLPAILLITPPPPQSPAGHVKSQDVENCHPTHWCATPSGDARRQQRTCLWGQISRMHLFRTQQDTMQQPQTASQHDRTPTAAPKPVRSFPQLTITRFLQI